MSQAATRPAVMSRLCRGSFKMACGCFYRFKGPEPVRITKNVGSTFECSKHGEQVIVRTAYKLIEGTKR